MDLQKRIAPLDGLRTFAAFGVVWIHSWTFAGYPSLKILGIDLFRTIAIVGNGMDFFFVISGFFMYLVLSKMQFSAPQYFRFIQNRWLRIAPAFYCSAFVYAGYYFIKDHNYPLVYNLATNLSFLGNIFQSSTIIGPFWSLGTEWHFYMILPFLFWAGSGKLFLKRVTSIYGIRWP